MSNTEWLTLYPSAPSVSTQNTRWFSTHREVALGLFALDDPCIGLQHLLDEREVGMAEVGFVVEEAEVATLDGTLHLWVWGRGGEGRGDMQLHSRHVVRSNIYVTGDIYHMTST